MRSAQIFFAFLVLTGCATPAPTKTLQLSFDSCTSTPFGFGDPIVQNLNVQKLIDLTEWVKNSKAPIFSILVSKNGKVIYEIYTSKIGRDDAHYLMSATKSVTSALMGVAVDRRFVKSPDESVADALPSNLFPSHDAQIQFQRVTIKDVLGMSALDAPVPPHLNTPATQIRQREFFHAENRAKFSLQESLLPEPGKSFQYTDVTPSIAAGVIQYSTGLSLYDFANQTLFWPMGFKNQEWMHEDRSGIDNGAYGLRLRPIDMQKFGILYLNQGCWEGKQLISKAWVNQSFEAWIKSKPRLKENDYGWYWWHYLWKNGWTAHIAAGWKGQRIAVFPEKNVVITLTALDENQTEDRLFGKVFEFVSAAVDTPANPDPTLSLKLKSQIEDVQKNESRIPRSAESRMVPSFEPKETHHAFSPD